MGKAHLVSLWIHGATARGATGLQNGPGPHVEVDSNQGTFVLELDRPRAPVIIESMIVPDQRQNP
jgi:hypothetical protein